MASYYKRDEFKDWLIREKVGKGLITMNTANQYTTYVGYIFDDSDLKKKKRNDFSSAMEMYQEFLKTLP